MEPGGGSGAGAVQSPQSGSGARPYGQTGQAIPVAEDLLSPMGLTIVLLASIVLTGLSLSTPLVIMALLPGCSSNDPHCFDYGREMTLTAADPQEGDPCEDFHSYVCSNFAELYPSRASFLALLNAKLSSFRDHVLDQHPVQGGDSVGRNVILAFRKCMEEYRYNFDSMVTLRLLLRSNGIHWTLTPLNFSPKDMLGVLLRLSLKYGVPVLLHASLCPSLKQTTENRPVLCLEFRAPQPQPGAVEWTVSIIEESLRLIAHNSTGISRFRRSALSTLRHLKELSTTLNAAVPWQGGLEYVKFSAVQEKLMSFINPLLFLKMTNEALNEAKKQDYFQPEDEIVTSTPTLIAAFSEFMISARPSALLRLLRYLVIESFVPVSAGRLTDIYGIGQAAALHMRVEACARAAIEVMPYAWQHLFYQERLQQRYTASDAAVRAILDSALAQYSWMDPETLQRADERLRRLRIVLGPTPTLTNSADITRRYRHMEEFSDSASFATWLLEQRAREVRSRNAELMQGGDASKTPPEPEPFLDMAPTAVLDPVRHQLLVSPALLFPPFFIEENRPHSDAVNYAALGSIVGSLLARHLDPVSGVYDILGVRYAQTWYAEASEAAYQDQLHCTALKQTSYERINATDEDASEALAYIVGLRMAHAAFRKRVKNHTASASGSALANEPSPLGIGASGHVYDQERLFFAAYCFQLCGVVLPRQVTHSLPVNVRCNLPLRQLQEFGKAYNCPSGSAMVSEQTCL